MKMKIGRKEIEDARNRIALVIAHMDKVEPDIALNYFTTLSVLNELLTEGEVKFSDDDCVYTTIKEGKNARGEEPTTTEVPGDISGTDTKDKGPEDGQEEVASDSLN